MNIPLNPFTLNHEAAISNFEGSKSDHHTRLIRKIDDQYFALHLMNQSSLYFKETFLACFDTGAPYQHPEQRSSKSRYPKLDEEAVLFCPC
ncbi:unnamed protein product [Ceutorhynchus assimilis]|uniref:Uncharacterized protein n=1 Tax=Ceutorhynchus assimilis TaxID=467358 RepID=A0A9N9MS94_9CUCU|nr:unnamed protein product [Ceutorhynchus assimilis]